MRKNLWKRTCAFLLTVCMLMTMMPVTAWALTLEEIEARGAGNCLLSVDALFPDMPEVRIEDARTERALRNGADVKLSADFEGECRVYAGSGEFLLLGAVKNGVLHTIKSFFEV